MTDMVQTINDTLLAELQSILHENIPLTRCMGLKVMECNGKGLLLSAPLEPNINHAATAFGGSLSSAATLACWGMLWLMLKQRSRSACIMVQESNISFVRPVTRDFIAQCYYPSDAALDRLLQMYDNMGRGRIEMQSEIYEGSQPCVGFTGKFVLLPE